MGCQNGKELLTLAGHNDNVVPVRLQSGWDTSRHGGFDGNAKMGCRFGGSYQPTRRRARVAERYRVQRGRNTTMAICTGGGVAAIGHRDRAR